VRVTLISIAALLASAVHARDQANAFCSHEWPSDYVMQEHCVQNQRQAAHRLLAVSESFDRRKFLRPVPGPDGHTYMLRAPELDRVEIFNKCMKDWDHDYGTDFVMVEHCWTQQLGAYDRLSNDK
jgi:hypothetical protein